jgi:Tol biopolymer transport system component
MDGFGVFGPSGKEVVFMRDGRLWSVALDGGKTTQLTRGEKRWDAVPAWRPGSAGEYAFIRLPLGGGESKVMLLDRQKNKESELVSESVPIGYLAWAPDGKTLYYTTPQTLYKLDIASGNRSRVLSLKEGWELTAGGVAVSPDGNTLVFGAGPRMERGVRYDLYAMPLKGAQVPPERLTMEGGIMPAFAPGQPMRIAYRNPINRTGIYVLSLPDHQITSVVQDDPRGMYFHPSWSPDGLELVISRLALDATPPPEGTGFISHLYRFPVKRDLPTAREN